jgi:L-threonylcarbamoyladenylate synthase
MHYATIETMTDVIRVDASRPDAESIAIAAARLRSGELVAFPTETVYGLGVHALDRAAVRRLFEAKGRPPTDPLIVHVRSLEDARSLISSLPESASALAARFWPGPLTLVMRRSAIVPDEVTASLDTVAVRVPAHPVALAFIEAAAIPIAAPSANLFSRPSPTRASHVLEDLDGRIDLVIDGGPTTVGVESTVLDLTGETPIILRPGAVTAAMLRQVLPHVDDSAAVVHTSAMPAPGMLERHYSPRAPLTLYEGPNAIVLLIGDAFAEFAAKGGTLGILAADEDRQLLPHGTPHFHVIEVGSIRDPATVAAGLYSALREMDAAGVHVILARDFPADDGLSAAIHDRLRRAAARRIVTR